MMVFTGMMSVCILLLLKFNFGKLIFFSLLNHAACHHVKVSQLKFPIYRHKIILFYSFSPGFARKMMLFLNMFVTQIQIFESKHISQ